MLFQTKPTVQVETIKESKKFHKLDLCVYFKQLSQLALIINIFIKLPKNCVKSLNKKNGARSVNSNMHRLTRAVKKANKWILNELTPDVENEPKLLKRVIKHRR